MQLVCVKLGIMRHNLMWDNYLMFIISGITVDNNPHLFIRNQSMGQTQDFGVFCGYSATWCEKVIIA